MGFQDTFNDRVMPAMERAFGTAVTFRRGISLIALTVPFGRRETAVDRKALLNDKGATVRTREFPVTTSDLEVDGAVRWPEAGDEFTWIDGASGEQIWVVFPLVSDQCYRFFDNTDTRLRVYTVAKDELRELRLTPKAGSTLNISAIVTGIRSQENFVDIGQTTKLLATDAYIPRSVFVGAGIDAPPMMATAEIHGLAGWSVNLSETEWGAGLVKLSLQRESLAREWQAQKNATV